MADYGLILFSFSSSFLQLCGGMPEAIEIYLATGDLTQALQTHHSILDTYENDFNKYATRTALQRLRRVYRYVPAAIGEKFKYSNINPAWQAREARAVCGIGSTCRPRSSAESSMS